MSALRKALGDGAGGAPYIENVTGQSYLVRSCRIARRQSALSWELRAVLDLARIRARQGDCEQGRNALSTIYDRFTEGFATRDLQTAAQLVRELDPLASRAAV